MEPNYNVPRVSPEQSPSLPPVTPEVIPSPETRFEQAPQTLEREPTPQPAPAQQQPAHALPQPVTDDNALTTDAAAVSITSLPDVAADDDVIEKEWVNKAKHIIAETTDDPYRREEAIKQLQKDYMRKRYNKEMGASE